MSLVGEMLLRRLEDESFSVASMAVQCDLDMISDSTALLNALMLLLKTASERLLHEHDSVAQGAALRVVAYLEEKSTSRFSDLGEEICLGALEHLFPYCQRHVVVSIAVGRLLRSADHPIAQQISECIDFLCCDGGEISVGDFIE